jgi:ArsR family transcriptional regulator
MKKVLFLCTANSARSQMAEVLLRTLAGDRFEVFSAGTDPSPIDSRALAALEFEGLDAAGLHPKSVDSLTQQHFDFIISLCREARDECARWPGSGVQIAWDMPDPVTSVDPDAFARTLQQLRQRIQAFVAAMADSVETLEEALSPVDVFKALAEPVRLQSLLLIHLERELCVCELIEALNQPQPKISRNLAQLRKVGLLLDRRQGQWVFYRLHPMLPVWIGQTLQLVEQGNPSFLAEARERLQAMSARPSRCGATKSEL